jgi:hypothetical protein
VPGNRESAMRLRRSLLLIDKHLKRNAWLRRSLLESGNFAKMLWSAIILRTAVKRLRILIQSSNDH